MHTDALVAAEVMEYVPAGHGTHTDAVVAPVTLLQNPREHDMHVKDPFCAAYDPAAHCEQEVLPLAANEPTRHCVHADRCELGTDPAEHAMQLAFVPLAADEISLPAQAMHAF